MSQHETDTTEIATPAVPDTGTIENALREFWDKARAAAALIAELRTERRSLNDRLTEVEREFAALRSELTAKEQEMKRLRVENVQLLSSNGHEFLTDDEKESLKSRIRELIARINSHL